MAAPGARPSIPDGLDPAELTVGIVSARWNPDIVERLTAGARRAVEAAGATAHEMTVPGAFELPFGARVLADRVDAIVVVGAVIRGETTHYELVSQGCASGVMRVQLDTGTPIGFGVVTVEYRRQAIDRSEDAGGHNVGEDAACAAIEMAIKARDLG